jgi:tRNA threonylcarbamoyladenosine biosynthesis protein TsaB
MLTVAFDTCLDACSAAVWDERGVRAYRFAAMRQGHAERLVPMIAEVLDAAGCQAAGVQAIAVTIGPGTFTGTRICVAAARGLALATGARVLAATSTALLAATARARFPAETGGRPLAVCIDARKGEVLLEIVPVVPVGGLDRVRMLSPAAAAAAIAAEATEALLIGNGALLLGEAGAPRLAVALADLLPDARHLMSMPLTSVAHPTPLYARPPDARPPADPAIARAP